MELTNEQRKSLENRTMIASKTGKGKPKRLNAVNLQRQSVNTANLRRVTFSGLKLTVHIMAMGGFMKSHLRVTL